MAPIEVPTTRSGRMPSESSIRMTPRWASPLAPPPASTSAVLPAGQALWAASGPEGRWARRARRASPAKRERIDLESRGPPPCAGGTPPAYLSPFRAPPEPPKDLAMTYVITEACIGVKDRACVDVCPVDCIYEAEDQLMIHPDECIDCGACEPECPVNAIYPEEDVPENLKAYIAKNKDSFSSPNPPGRPQR